MGVALIKTFDKKVQSNKIQTNWYKHTKFETCSIRPCKSICSYKHTLGTICMGESFQDFEADFP